MKGKEGREGGRGRIGKGGEGREGRRGGKGEGSGLDMGSPPLETSSGSAPVHSRLHITVNNNALTLLIFGRGKVANYRVFIEYCYNLTGIKGSVTCNHGKTQ